MSEGSLSVVFFFLVTYFLYLSKVIGLSVERKDFVASVLPVCSRCSFSGINASISRISISLVLGGGFTIFRMMLFSITCSLLINFLGAVHHMEGAYEIAGRIQVLYK